MAYLDDTLRADDGTELSLAKWDAANPRGVVCGLHGLGEHARRYGHVAAAWNAIGFSFRMADHRGHGRSPGKRGDAPYELAEQDAMAALNAAAEEGLPVVLYGHSFGGGLALRLMVTRPLRIACAIATSPWLMIRRPMGKPLVTALSVMRRVAPHGTLSNGLDASGLTHDEEVVRAYREDPLVHDRVSFGLASGAHSAGLGSIESAGDIRVPLLLLHSADDPICDPEGSRRFAKQAGLRCLYHEYEGMFHELHNEPVWRDAFEREAAFVARVLAGQQ